MSEATVDGKPTLGQQLARVGGHIGNLPRGEQAILRRMERRRDEPAPDAFWQIVEKYDLPPWDEPFWVAVMPLMVRVPYQKGRPAGKALAAARVSSLRFDRWLRRDRESAWRGAWRLLAAVDGGIDWPSFGYLLRDWDDEQKRRLARDYYLSSGDDREATEGDDV